MDSEHDLQTVDIGSVDLDIFALCKANTRKKTFVQLTRRFVADDLLQLPSIDQNKFTTFLETVFDKCRSYNVSYHNDMHNLDVA